MVFRARPIRRALSLCITCLLIGGALPQVAQAQPDAVQAAKSSVAAEIRAQVGGKYKDFYGPRGYWPLWVEQDRIGPQADALLAMIEDSEADGLDPHRYDSRNLKRLIEEADASATPKALARVDLALSRSFASLVADMRRPVRGVTIRYLDKEVEPRDADPSDILRSAALTPSLTDYIQTAGWMSPLYMRLRNARANYLKKWGDLPDILVPEDVKMRPGGKGADIAALRQRLGLADGDTYDKALVAKVRAFQTDHGLKPDGVAGAMTVAALNQGPARYERLLSLNLERARLLPGPWTRNVVVDAASARLWYYSKGALDGTMKVVAGAKESQTPLMAGMIRYATLNPYWNIPPDLVERKVAPKILNGGSLKAMHYEALTDWSANPAPLAQSAIDWDAVAAGRQEVRVRQLPGGDNAMGRIKYMFPNDLGIYLHDTPQRELFAKEDRHFSNGCVRLEDALRLGRWFFGKLPDADGDAPEQHVPLPQAVPVYLTYLTAVPTAQGVQFLPDVYGRDGE
ncbi:L,D-transpeptidase family protein [Sphingobium sp. BYY-5]|uniref:L,D-transpeptidase family protein n=1 Tax=Sphingobium sp. BYY-5 TaxID=2926400 RepID=UPI001FA6EABD|nr:L,D-transpeptidase family protein [Sphingobium sp. BYY-5]MCI4589040.1 L,D-transpeptidase family protein [Sphingobium sp. BYY-5]